MRHIAPAIRKPYLYRSSSAYVCSHLHSNVHLLPLALLFTACLLSALLFTSVSDFFCFSLCSVIFSCSTVNLLSLASSNAWKAQIPDPEPAAGRSGPSGRVTYPPPPGMLPHRPTLPRTHVTRLTLIQPDIYLLGVFSFFLVFFFFFSRCGPARWGTPDVGKNN